MASKTHSQKTMKVGDKVVVTIEDAIPDCVIVSMVFQQRKFCGALMDTTKKNSPHGINEDREEPKIETRRSASKAKLKRSQKPPFPQPLLTRHSYKQDVPQPPLRNIFRRIRRSRRNARVNIVSSLKEASVRNQKINLRTHNSKCRCPQCLQYKKLSKSALNKKNENKTLKRKATDVKKASPIKKLKGENSAPPSSDEDVNKADDCNPQTMASPLKHLLPRKSIDCSTRLQHNEASIKDKATSSPLNVPSSNHVVASQQPLAVPSKINFSLLKTDATSSKPNTVGSKFILASSVVTVEPSKRDKTKSNNLSLKHQNNFMQHTPAIKIKYKSPAGRGRIVNIPSKPHGRQDRIKSPGLNLSAESVQSSRNKKIHVAESKPITQNKLKMLKKIAKVEVQDVPYSSRSNGDKEGGHNSFMVFVKHDEKDDRLRSSTPSPVKNNAIQKPKSPKSLDKKVVHRARKSLQKPGKPSASSSTTASGCDNVDSRHLRIILQPLNSKVGTNVLNSSAKPRDASDKHLNNLRLSPNQDSKKVGGAKKTPSPLSHTMYVTTCKDISGIVYAQNDVVWSKLAGYPWWPSRIIKLIVTKTDGEILQQEVMVAWFCSSTTSIIPLSCIQPFEKSFDIRYEKRRKGVYQKAVNEARSALKKMSSEVRKLISQFET